MFLANGAGIGAWAASIPAVKDGLGLSAGALGTALLAVAAGAMLAMPVAGWLRARGVPRVLTASGLLTPCALALPGLAGSWWQLAGALLVFGACNGAMDVCMNARATEVERDAGRPIMSSFHAAFSLGELLGAGIPAGLRWAGSGVEPGLLATSGLVAALVLAHGALDRQRAAAAAASRRIGWPAWGLVASGLLCLLGFMTEGAVVDWSGVFMEHVAGLTGPLAVSGFAGFTGAMIAGRLGGDWAVRRLGPVWVLRWGGLLAAAGLATAIAWPVTGMLGFAAVGLGVANVAPVLFTAAGRAGRAASTGVATVATLGYAGMLLGPPIIGAVADWAGLRWAPLLVAAAMLAVAASARRAE